MSELNPTDHKNITARHFPRDEKVSMHDRMMIPRIPTACSWFPQALKRLSCPFEFKNVDNNITLLEVLPKFQGCLNAIFTSRNFASQKEVIQIWPEYIYLKILENHFRNPETRKNQTKILPTSLSTSLSIMKVVL